MSPADGAVPPEVRDPRPHPTEHPSRRPVGLALGVAAVAVAVLSWWAGAYVPAFRVLDVLGRGGALAAEAPLLELAEGLRGALRVRWVALAVAGATVLLWWRGARWGAAAPLLLVAGANLTVQAGAALPRPEMVGDMTWNSWPSGHAAAAASAGLALVVAAPPRWRAAAAGLSAAVTALVGVAVIGGGGHHPLDSVGGILLAGAWAVAVGPWATVGGSRPEVRRQLRAPAGTRGRSRGLWPSVMLATLAGAALTAAVVFAAGVGSTLEASESQRTAAFLAGVLLVVATTAAVHAAVLVVCPRRVGAVHAAT